MSGVAVLAVALPLSSAQAAHAAAAGPGEWDDLGSHDVFYRSMYRTDAVKSAGGDFKACITTTTTENEAYHLREGDGDPQHTQRVATVYGAGCWIFRDIGSYVDGDNNRAEFFIGTTDGSMLRVHYWD